MEALVVNFRRGRKNQTCNQMVIKVEGMTTSDKAKSLIGKSVVWKSPAGKELKGVVRDTHGNSGAVRVLFETGMPGQAIGKKVELN